MNSDFLYKKNDYLTFDPTTMRDLIVNRLNEGSTFTDQNYAGSNLSALVDVMSVIFGSLMFYLNKTSSESLFSESQIYENINRIVKILNYNPTGRFTNNVLINLNASQDLPVGSYVIPRYTYFYLGATTYSFNKDIFFSKSTPLSENIESVSGNTLIYQGLFEEYADYTALGIDNEVITLPAVINERNIDHLNIHVYTKNNITNKWIQWEQTDDLYSAFPSELKFETRFNSNKTYEIKFGDDINGKKLTNGDSVSIFYLTCNPNSSSLSKNALLGADPLKLYNSENYMNIIKDVQNIILSNYNTNLNALTLDNNFPSSNFVPEETTEQIKNNAPKIFNAQKRLVTTNDYKYFILSQFSGFVKDAFVCNNDDYLDTHLKYLHDIGLSSPHLKKSILYNHINFGTSCNFNNVYAYMVPQSQELEELNLPQKQLISNSVNKYKTLTSRFIPMEPEILNVDFYIKNPDIEVSVSDLNNCRLLITKDKNANRTSASIRLEVKSIIEDFFKYENLKLGYFLNISELSSLISNIKGVLKIQTSRKDINLNLPQLSFLIWNENYKDLDCKIYNQNTQFENFKFLKFFDLKNLINKIDVI